MLPQNEVKGGIWRGQAESCYKIYNTFQRKNLKSKTPVENVVGYIDGLLDELSTWNKRGVIGKYFRNYGIKSVPIYAKLSILRHYEIPSPLLDWTRNPRVALYFATLHQDIMLEEEEIDNYFSIYFLNKEHLCFRFSSKTGIEFFTSNNPGILLKRLMTFKRLRVSKEKINCLFNDKKFIRDGIYKNPIQRIDDSENELVNHYTMSNYNITAQVGLFVLNVDPCKPLEEHIFERVNNHPQRGWLFTLSFPFYVSKQDFQG